MTRQSIQTRLDKYDISMIKISQLYTYPVKSLGGIQLKASELSPFGLKHDRRWMIVDNNGKFISQRESCKMATINTAIKDDELVLSHNNSEITVPSIDDGCDELLVSIWSDTFKATHVSQLVDKWLTDILGQDCQLVYMDDTVQRQIDVDFAPKGQNVSFADAYPILVISQASIDDLNAKLDILVNINRFRANIIVSGTKPFAEDNWNDLSINSLKYKAVKLCSRCIIPSINQETGEQDQVKMLAVLNRYRKIDKKIKFGQNIIYKNVNIINQQTISCGDEIKLIN